MRLKESMIPALTSLLQEGETLYAPVYGLLEQDGTSGYAFFGLTDTHLLVALLSAKATYDGDGFRVPLEELSLDIVKKNVYRLHSPTESSFTITCADKVLLIPSQKENAPSFKKRLESKTTRARRYDLPTTRGEKLRRQYFTSILVTILAFMPGLFLSMGAMLLVYENTTVTFGEVALIVLCVMLGICAPFLLLAVLNRFCFGKILCVVGRDGLYLEDRFIPWGSLKAVTYDPRLFLGRSRSYYGTAQEPDRTKAILTLLAEDGREYTLSVLHFPRYGLKYIAKKAPEVKISWAKGCVRRMLISVLGISAVLVVIGLLRGLE